MLCVHDRFYIMFAHIVTQKHIIQYFISQMVYDVNFTTRNYKKIVSKSLLDYIRHIYSNPTFGIIGYDRDYDLGLGLFGEIDLAE